MKKIYIMLSFTGTILSKIIKIRTNEEYAHSSISLDKELENLYSFGRINPYIAFWGGFVKEGINTGTFNRFKNTQVGIYSIEVTDKQYSDLADSIEYIKKNKKEYKFNILGLFLASVNKKRTCTNKLYCAEFVKYVLEKADIDTAGLPDIIKPEDFKKMKNTELIYSGYLRDYNK